MDLKDSIKQISDRVEKLKSSLMTEEATKNALIMPFITALGYDVFNPYEVIPEMDCDLIKTKGEKIDYAILKDGEPIILIECKHWQQDLNLHNTQLQKYFVASKAKFGILTNGIIYRFYTDLAKANIMDDKPFLEINMLDVKDNQIDELKKFHKSYFNVDDILNSASELKYMSELKNSIIQEFNNPSPDFVKYFGKQIYDGIFTAKVLEQFTALTKRAFIYYINDVISDRLKAAIPNENENEAEGEKPTIQQEPQGKNQQESKINTTEEELQSYYIVKSILHNTIATSRITYRDAQSYFAIFIDDNNRKPVCRIYLNSQTNKKLILLDDNKKEVVNKISSIDDIYKYSDQLISFVEKYK